MTNIVWAWDNTLPFVCFPGSGNLSTLSIAIPRLDLGRAGYYDAACGWILYPRQQTRSKWYIHICLLLFYALYVWILYGNTQIRIITLVIHWVYILMNSSIPGQNDRRCANYMFKYIFVNEKYFILIKSSLKFVTNSPINNKPALVWIMAWCRIGDKFLSESMLIRFTDAYMRHLGEIN